MTRWCLKLLMFTRRTVPDTTPQPENGHANMQSDLARRFLFSPEGRHLLRPEDRPSFAPNLLWPFISSELYGLSYLVYRSICSRFVCEAKYG